MTLAVQDLVVARGEVRLGPISFEVAPGRRLAVIGPNGGGKTTLLKTMAGLLRPEAGFVRISGEPVRRRSGRPPPAAYLPPPGETAAPFVTRHLVALGRLHRRRWPADIGPEDLAAADAALGRLDAGHLADRRFDRLSSGQRQLALIARTLLQDSPVVLLDEPTATLDPGRRARVAHAVRTLADAGRVVVFATHEPAEAAEADLCLLVGRELAFGPPQALLTPDRLSALYGLDVATGRRP